MGIITQLLPWAACPSASQPFKLAVFPNIQPKLYLAQLEAISSFAIACCLEKGTDPHPALLQPPFT